MNKVAIIFYKPHIFPYFLECNAIKGTFTFLFLIGQFWVGWEVPQQMEHPMLKEGGHNREYQELDGLGEIEQAKPPQNEKK